MIIGKEKKVKERAAIQAKEKEALNVTTRFKNGYQTHIVYFYFFNSALSTVLLSTVFLIF